jgi:hypothetical protein
MRIARAWFQAGWTSREALRQSETVTAPRHTGLEVVELLTQSGRWPAGTVGTVIEASTTSASSRSPTTASCDRFRQPSARRIGLRRSRHRPRRFLSNRRHPARSVLRHDESPIAAGPSATAIASRVRSFHAKAEGKPDPAARPRPHYGIEGQRFRILSGALSQRPSGARRGGD